jgi:hypothetical protein
VQNQSPRLQSPALELAALLVAACPQRRYFKLNLDFPVPSEASVDRRLV